MTTTTTTPTPTTTTSPTMSPVSELDRVRHTPLTLPPGDADVYLIAETLLGHRRGERFEQPPVGDAPSPTLALALARLTPIALLRFLHARGSERPVRVLRARGDTVVVKDGALLDNDDDGGDGTFDLRCQLWPMAVFRLTRDLLPLVERRRGAGHEPLLQGLGRTARQRLREGLAAPATATGDHVAFACAHEHLPRLGLPTAFEVFMGRGLAAASPYAHLHRLDDAELPPLDTAALLRPPLVRLLELTGPGLGEGWARSLRRAVAHSADIDELMARSRAFSRALVSLVQALDRAARLDLLEGVVAFLLALPGVLPEDTRARLVRLPGVVTMADRDRVVAAVAGAFDVLDAVDAVTRALAMVRFGDERFVEARTVAAVIAPLQAHRAALDAARRALTGVVG